MFREELGHIPWEIIKLQETIDECWHAFKDLFLTAADKHAPIVMRRVCGYLVPWLTSDLKQLMHERNYHHKKAISTNKLHWSNYKRLCNTINTRMCKENYYYSNQLAEGKDSKEMWQTLHKIVSKKTKTVPPSGDGLTASCLNGFLTSIADTLSSHFDCSTLPKVLTPKVNHDFVLEEISSSFVPKELLQMKSTKAMGLDGISARLLKDSAPEVSELITYIINLTISTSTIPSEWKPAKVTPIYKSGVKTDPNNYRPISVLPLISKVMERAIQSQLLNSISYQTQSPFD